MAQTEPRTITQSEHLQLVGLAALGIGVRLQLDRIDKAIGKIIEPEPDPRWGTSDAGGELLYNAGDDAVKAVEDTMRRWNVTVEEVD